MNIRYANNLHILSVRLTAIQTSSTYSAIKIFKTLPPSISGLKNDKTVFKSALREYNLTRFLFHRIIFVKWLTLVYF